VKTQTETLIKALRQLSEDIQSEDGVANACVAESAQRLEELGAMIMQLRDGIAKQNITIEQTCGKVLDYPWFKDDQKNFPGATEKHGVCVGDHVAETIAAELARKYTEAMQHIKRLESAGDELICYLRHRIETYNSDSVFHGASIRWGKAKKEAKP
jgi:hypothetical protein